MDQIIPSRWQMWPNFVAKSDAAQNGKEETE